MIAKRSKCCLSWHRRFFYQNLISSTVVTTYLHNKKYNAGSDTVWKPRGDLQCQEGHICNKRVMLYKISYFSLCC